MNLKPNAKSSQLELAYQLITMNVQINHNESAD